MAVNTNKMEEFLGKFVNDLGAAVHAGMVVIGERLGAVQGSGGRPTFSHGGWRP